MQQSGQSYMQAHEEVRSAPSLINSESIPQWADYPLDNDLPWNVFPLGLGENNAMITWDILTAAHAWIAGQTGAGKSIAQRNIVLHCLRHPQHWDFYGVDFKRADMATYTTITSDVIQSIDYTLQETAQTLKFLQEEMDQRYQLIAGGESSGVLDLSTINRKNVLLMIDEVGWLLPSHHDPLDSPEDYEVAEIRRDAQKQLYSLVRKGRTVGIHVVLSTQVIGSSLIHTELYDNMSMRYVLRNHSKNYQALLGQDMSDVLDPAQNGRAVISINGDLKGVQTFYTDLEELHKNRT